MWQFSSGLFAGIIIGSAGTVAYAMRSHEIREFLVDVAVAKVDQVLRMVLPPSPPPVTHEETDRIRDRIRMRKS